MSDVLIKAPPLVFPKPGQRARATMSPGRVNDPGWAARRQAFIDEHGFPPMEGGAVTATWFGKVFQMIFDDSGKQASLATPIDWNTDTINCALLNGAGTIDEDTNVDWTDVSATEVSAGGGYTTGGEQLTTPAVTLDTANNRLELDADDAQWTSATFSATHAVIYKDSGVDANSPLLGYVDFGGTETVSSGTFTITWDAEGILQIAY